ncbi:MAG: hypothetical protein V1743_07725 [Nanoarchaeota archaeon]
MQKILLNTGLFVKKGVYDINTAIEIIDKLPVDGVEIGLSFLDQLKNFRLSQQSFSILKKKEFVSIHAPVNFLYSNDAYTKDVLNKLKQVYDLVNAQYAVFHLHTIKDLSIFDDSSLTICMENDRGVYNQDAEVIKKILEPYPKLKFLLDTNHAMSVSEKEVGALVKKLKSRILAIHLSIWYQQEEHVPCHLVSEEALAQAEPIKKLDIPIVLESWHKYQDNIGKEIEFVKNWLTI